MPIVMNEMRHEETLLKMFMGPQSIVENRLDRISQILKYTPEEAKEISDEAGPRAFEYAKALRMVTNFRQTRLPTLHLSSIISVIEHEFNFLSDRALGAGDVERLMNDPVFTKKLNSSQLNDVKAIADFASERSEELSSRKSKKPVDQKMIKMKFDNGWYWLQLDSCTDEEEEGRMMRHCGTAAEEKSTLYSLRDSSNKPHVTLEFDEELGKVVQKHGKANSAIKPEYLGYVDKLEKKLLAGEKIGILVLTIDKLPQQLKDKAHKKFLFFANQYGFTISKLKNVGNIFVQGPYQEILEMSRFLDPGTFEINKTKMKF